MTPDSDSPEPCLERAGFLFAHDCPRPASRQCARCSKAICAEHTHLTGGQELCTGCVRVQLQGDSDETPPGPPPSVQTLSPLLFASYYYQGHGYYGRGAWNDELLQDPHDFTEADGEALRKPLEAQRFEEDMQGS